MWTVRAALALVIVVTSCASWRSVERARDRGEGTAAVYPVPRDRAWQAARDALRAEGAIVEELPERGELRGTWPASATDLGGFAGVWIAPVTDNASSVLAVTRRNDLGTPTEAKIHARISALLGLAPGPRAPGVPALATPTSPTSAPPTDAGPGAPTGPRS